VTELDALLAANRRYAATFDRSGEGEKPAPPARKLAVLCCMDARMQPEAFLGLALGDAHLIRNAGGRASDDAIRSLVISTHLLGTREIVVIHHTSCGMMSFSNDDLRAQLRRDLGADAAGIDFLPFADLEQSVRDDVQTIRSSRLLPRDITVAGMVYDVRTGEIRLPTSSLPDQ
jgi:carbonic anhydrase